MLTILQEWVYFKLLEVEPSTTKLFLSETDVVSNCDATIYCVFALANFICKQSEQYNILSEAELACKGEADGHTFYVMSMR